MVVLPPHYSVKKAGLNATIGSVIPFVNVFPRICKLYKKACLEDGIRVLGTTSTLLIIRVAVRYIYLTVCVCICMLRS